MKGVKGRKILSVDIEKTSYTKLEMSQDIDAYVAFIPRSDAVTAVMTGSDKQLFVPRACASRHQLAAAIIVGDPWICTTVP